MEKVKHPEHAHGEDWTYNEVKQEIQKAIEPIQRSIAEEANSLGEELDQLKMQEMDEMHIMDLLWKYCLAQGYNYKGFPKRYMEYIENDDPDFGDFFDFDTHMYFLHLIARDHNDVAELMDLWGSVYPTHTPSTKESLESFIEIYESEGVDLIFNKSEWERPSPKPPRIP